MLVDVTLTSVKIFGCEQRKMKIRRRARVFDSSMFYRYDVPVMRFDGVLSFDGVLELCLKDSRKM